MDSFRYKLRLLNRISSFSQERYSKMSERSNILFEAAIKSKPLSKKEWQDYNKLSFIIDEVSNKFNETYNELLALGIDSDTIDDFLFYNRMVFGIPKDNIFHNEKSKQNKQITC